MVPSYKKLVYVLSENETICFEKSGSYFVGSYRVAKYCSKIIAISNNANHKAE